MFIYKPHIEIYLSPRIPTLGRRRATCLTYRNTHQIRHSHLTCLSLVWPFFFFFLPLPFLLAPNSLFPCARCSMQLEVRWMLDNLCFAARQLTYLRHRAPQKFITIHGRIRRRTPSLCPTCRYFPRAQLSASQFPVRCTTARAGHVGNAAHQRPSAAAPRVPEPNVREPQASCGHQMHTTRTHTTGPQSPQCHKDHVHDQGKGKISTHGAASLSSAAAIFRPWTLLVGASTCPDLLPPETRLSA